MLAKDNRLLDTPHYDNTPYRGRKRENLLASRFLGANNFQIKKAHFAWSILMEKCVYQFWFITIPGSTLNRLDKGTKCRKHVDC